ncbi:hypothetical protein C5167_034594 [Papaver somniferum]|uniref:Uncharacterized protein n=1 Tax=Papaver somniferum TaxID=3469 RepID=A0A4Y7KGU0_PAPSO|nr:hypothetical protein C5167_034594 [Papaver somniferum]
MALCLLQPVED